MEHNNFFTNNLKSLSWNFFIDGSYKKSYGSRYDYFALFFQHMTLSCFLLCLSRSLMPPNGIQMLKRMILAFSTCHITFCRENCFVIAGRVGNSIYLKRFISSNNKSQNSSFQGSYMISEAMFLHDNKNITDSFLFLLIIKSLTLLLYFYY